MSETTPEFLQDLAHRGYEPLWRAVTGAVRIEVLDDGSIDRWLVVIDDGDATVSHADGDADCVVQVEKDLLERLARGEAQFMAALLRGEIACHGDMDLALALQRVFPGPSGQERPAPIGRSNRWTP
jgi:SCP-2 sterol transfer family